MKELTCIVCPRGCHLTIDDNMNVSGNFCKRGERYAKQEMLEPKRNISSTVSIISNNYDRLPVKTSCEIAKDKIFDAMKVIHSVTVKAPVRTGDIIVKSIAGTDVDIIAAKTILE